MSEEEAFLNAIAADRADRTRLLVFADWLADRDDPREEFVRLHARLLELDGTEREFEKLDKQWGKWVGGRPFVRPHRSKLTDRWLDALCRVFTTADVEGYPANDPGADEIFAEFGEYADFIDNPGNVSLWFFNGKAADYPTPFQFVLETLQTDCWPTLRKGKKALAKCYPLTRGRFWRIWRDQCANLHEPPELPEVDAENLFLGAQFITGDGDNWGIVATHQHDYFALYWAGPV
ncbi:MAG: TIGR02996 domain-containing protein [Planctomycetia bacterium]|nr:TIGR02996 domain-containing protein [Planctomycetia bacterium]